MHRKQNTDLIPVDTELERTLRSLRKTKRPENSAMAEERQDQTERQRTAARRPLITDTMEDFWRPIIQDEYSAIRQPTFDANNFELKPALITMVQLQQFIGHPTEDPNEHLGKFLRMANTVKLNGVRPEVIKLHLFPFSLRDTATTWYESLPYGSVDTWEELVEAYLGRFFPPSLASERRREIIVFQQGEDESLYIAWERFKRLLKRCPMHGIDLKTQMDIVYHALNDTSKGIIDASCCGAFKRKSTEEARDLIEDLAKCNMKAPSEFSRSIGRGRGIMELSKMTAMEAKLDAIMNRMDKQERKMHTAHEIGAIERELLRGSADVPTEELFYDAEEVKYLGEPRSYHFKPNPNLPAHYHPALRNHENFSYGGGTSQGPRHGQNPQQGYQQPPRFLQQQQGSENRNEYQGQRRAQPFEDQMLQAMWAIKKLNFDFKIEREERLLQLNELEELRNEAYDNARIYKDKTKKWHDQRIMRKGFREGDQVLLFNSIVRLFLGKLKSKWSGPYTVMSSTTFGTVTLKTDAGEEFKVNGQRLKHYQSREE